MTSMTGRALFSRITFSAVILAALAAAPVAAQEIAHTQFFPILARTAGVGTTQWVTDLTVHNVTDDDLMVGVQFLPADTANVFNPTFPERFPLAANETLLIEDALNGLFGYDTEILAITRTYNKADPAGTYGQTVPALSRTINAAPTKSIITGAVNSERFRSNLGAMNMTFIDELRIFFRVLDGDGNEVADGMKTLQPASVSQWSFASLGVPKQDGALTVELWMHPDDVLADPCAANFPTMFMAYVSKVDGNPDGTGDAEFIYAAPHDPYDCR